MRRPLNLWLVVIVVICGVSIWFGKGANVPALKQGPAAIAKSPTEDFSKQDDVSSIHLLILNGTQEKGLARDFSLMVSRIGCVAQGTGNAPTKPWRKSLLVNRRLGSGRVKQLADKLGGLPVITEFDGRATEDVVLVLGQDHLQIREKLNPRNLLDDHIR